MSPGSPGEHLLAEGVQALHETARRRERPRPASLSGPARALVMAALLLLAAAPLPPEAGAQPVGPLPAPPKVSELSRGKLLVAHPKIKDPRFQQSVLLIVDHGPMGTLGLIINQPTNARLHGLLPQPEHPDQGSEPLYNGGPVGRSGMLVLLRAKKAIEGSLPVADGVFLSGSLEVLTRLLGGDTKVEAFRVYAGYAVWGPGQLAHEVLRGDFYVVPAEADTIFDENPAGVWAELMRKLTANWVSVPPAGRGGRREGAPRVSAAEPSVNPLPACSPLPAQPAAQKLSEKEGADNHGKTRQVPAQAGEHAERDHEGHRQVNRQEPTAGEPHGAGPPVAEGKIQDENHAGQNPELRHSRIS